jgi:hypothetical protein
MTLETDTTSASIDLSVPSRLSPADVLIAEQRYVAHSTSFVIYSREEFNVMVIPTILDASEDACTVQYAQPPQHSFILCLFART